MRHTTIDNTADILDSRDIIDRIATLQRERDNFAQEVGPEWHDVNPEDAAELAALEALQEEAEGYCPDWKHGATLIRDSYFTDYMQELLEDIGGVPKDMPEYLVIDWDATARNIQQNYTEVDFDGVAYWFS